MAIADKPDYLTCYQVLGVERRASWEQLKRAYHKMARRWHPDRVVGSAAKHRESEEKIREINRAYKVLSTYYHDHDALPYNSHPETEKTDSYPHVNKMDAQRAFDEQASKFREFSQSLMANRYALPALAISFVMLWAAVLIISWDADRVPQLPYENKAALETLNPDQYFSYAATPEMVLQLEGQPSYRSGNVWYYNESVVYFEDGRVVGWISHPDRPLHKDPEYPDSYFPRIR